MSLGWSMGQKSGVKELVSEVTMVHLVQISKPAHALISHYVSANSKYVTDTTEDYNNWKLYVNGLVIGLEIDQVCAKVLPLFVPMVVHTLEFDGNSASHYHKIL